MKSGERRVLPLYREIHIVEVRPLPVDPLLVYSIASRTRRARIRRAQTKRTFLTHQSRFISIFTHQVTITAIRSSSSFSALSRPISFLFNVISYESKSRDIFHFVPSNERRKTPSGEKGG
ncbi:hypothetical protein PRIPAC_74322 [Pristionchus pacificus]|nr:hypothetical protein PRIPAC_74322 [Pristionchus pacificus]